MSELVTLTIDGIEVSVPPGTLVVDAAKRVGINIPVFCYHPKMEPVGMCRMCLVDVGRPVFDRATGEPVLEEDGSQKIQFGWKLETGCTVEVSEGMVVRGATDEVAEARKDVVEFLLTSHPLDCPICDKGGECPLQDLTMDFGPGKSRFLFDEKIDLAKNVPLGDLIFLDRERCIQCARCTRFQSEIVDDPVIGFSQRGRSLQIVTFSDPGFDSYFSGNTTDICPVGALTTADFRFGARPWELSAAASICPHCPVGCNLTLNVRREAKAGGEVVVKRAMPRQNEWVNELWICDKGRFGYHFTESEDRLMEPLVRKGTELQPATWEEALEAAVAGIRSAGQDLYALASGRLSNEDLFNIQQLAAGIGGQAALYSNMAGGDLVGQIGLGEGSNLSELGDGDAILVVASDLEEEAPVWWLRIKQAAERGATLIVANPRPTKTDRYADHKLRYPYGAEAGTVLALVNALSAKRVDLPDEVGRADLTSEYETAAQAFAGAENAVVIYGSEGIGLAGSGALAQACANLLISTGHVGKPNNGLIAVWQRAITQGAWDLGLRPATDLKGTMNAAKALYLAGVDPVGDDPAFGGAIQSAQFVVVQEMFLTDTAKLADVVLPVRGFTEREGSFTTGERRVQRYYPAVPAQGDTRPDFTITAQIAAGLELDLAGRAASLVFKRIAAQVADYEGLTYRRLAEVVEQWPFTGHDQGERYYGGTAYHNSQGLGVQLKTAAQRGETAALTWPKAPALPASSGDQLLAVPVTRLYDRGRTLTPTKFLHARLAEPHVVVHPDEAAGLGIEAGATVHVHLNGTSTAVGVEINEDLPAGVVLVPRSLGMPIHGPMPVAIKVPVETG